MKPVVLTTARLVLNQPGLDQPGDGDRELITEYCRDPIFERFLTTPWPYEPRHADYFVDEHVPRGWASDTEYTWAIRRDGEFLGVIGYRAATSDLGCWLGAPHRGQGVMPESATAVIDWLFGEGVPRLGWECIVGNAASATVARKLGFSYTGEAPSALGSRDGSSPRLWHGTLAANDDRSVKEGWPL